MLWCCCVDEKTIVDQVAEPTVLKSPSHKPYEQKTNKVAHTRFQSTDIIDIKDALKNPQPLVLIHMTKVPHKKRE